MDRPIQDGCQTAFAHSKEWSSNNSNSGLQRLHTSQIGWTAEHLDRMGSVSCNDRAACLQTGHNASLGNGNALLLHCLHTHMPLALTLASIHECNDKTVMLHRLFGNCPPINLISFRDTSVRRWQVNSDYTAPNMLAPTLSTAQC